jgi:hypothetical protein
VTNFTGNAILLPPGDRESLNRVLSYDGDKPPRLYTYYAHVAGLFDDVGELDMVVELCNLALGAATAEDDVEGLWKKVVQYNADLGQFEDAFMALIDCPYHHL